MTADSLDTDSLFFPIILTDINKPWEKVLHLGTPLSFTAKSIISGGRLKGAAGFYFIRRGRIRLSYIASSGQEKVLLYMGRGMLFNEIPALRDVDDSMFTCVEDSDLVFLPRKIISEDFTRAYPDLMLSLLDSISRKMQHFYVQVCWGQSHSSFVRTCQALYRMHLHNRQRGKVVPSLTQQELAAFLGVHRSSLHKALSRLKDEGVIDQYSRKSLEIYNTELLHTYALAQGEE